MHSPLTCDPSFLLFQDSFDPTGSVSLAMSQDPFSPHEDVSGCRPYFKPSKSFFLDRTALDHSQIQAGLSMIHSPLALHSPMKIPPLTALVILEIFNRRRTLMIMMVF